MRFLRSLCTPFNFKLTKLKSKANFLKAIIHWLPIVVSHINFLQFKASFISFIETGQESFKVKVTNFFKVNFKASFLLDLYCHLWDHSENPEAINAKKDAVRVWVWVKTTGKCWIIRYYWPSMVLLNLMKIGCRSLDFLSHSRVNQTSHLIWNYNYPYNYNCLCHTIISF